MRCVVSCGSISFPWLVFFFGALVLQSNWFYYFIFSNVQLTAKIILYWLVSWSVTRNKQSPGRIMRESSGCMSNTPVQLVWRKSRKQLVQDRWAHLSKAKNNTKNNNNKKTAAPTHPYRAHEKVGMYRGETQILEPQVNVWFTIQNIQQSVSEEDWGKWRWMNLDGSSQADFLAVGKHTNLHSDLLQSSKRETLVALVSLQKGLNFCIRYTPPGVEKQTQQTTTMMVMPGKWRPYDRTGHCPLQGRSAFGRNIQGHFARR